MTSRPDRGSASVWVLAFGALVLVVGAIAGVRAGAVLARHRAETAADLAALAGAGRIGIDAEACAAARAIARANGTRLVACDLDLAADGRRGIVRVGVAAEATFPVIGRREVRASARAGRLDASGVADDPADPVRCGMLAEAASEHRSRGAARTQIEVRHGARGDAAGGRRSARGGRPG